MAKFNVGDKVKVTDRSIPSHFKIKYGEVYTVTETYGNRLYVGGGNGFYFDSQFELVDNLASTIASVKSGDRVTIRTKYATYAEFQVESTDLGVVVSIGEEIVIAKSEITELTITKPALPAEPGVGAIVKFETRSNSEQFQVRQEKGWTPIFMSGNFSQLVLPWDKTINMYGPKFEIIREGKK